MISSLEVLITGLITGAVWMLFSRRKELLGLSLIKVFSVVGAFAGSFVFESIVPDAGNQLLFLLSFAGIGSIAFCIIISLIFEKVISKKGKGKPDQ